MVNFTHVTLNIQDVGWTTFIHLPMFPKILVRKAYLVILASLLGEALQIMIGDLNTVGYFDTNKKAFRLEGLAENHIWIA